VVATASLQIVLTDSGSTTSRSRRDGFHHLLGVVPGAVEAPLDPALHPPPQGLEQEEPDQSGAGDQERSVRAGRNK